MIDEALLRAVNALAASPGVARAGVFLSSPWPLVLASVPIALLLLARRRFWAVAAIVVAMLFADALTSRIIKPVAARERPCRTLAGLERPAGCGPGKSFPSVHATLSATFVATAAPVVPLGWAVLAPLGVLVSISRILLGVHYPTDVAAGWALGAAIGLGFTRLRLRLERRPAQTDTAAPQNDQPSSP